MLKSGFYFVAKNLILLCIIFLMPVVLLSQTVVLNGITFQRQEIPRFEPSILDNIIHLNVPYAKSTILNPDDWDIFHRKDKKPYEIDLIYTRYPYDSVKWLTAYDKLMGERVKELQALDPTLKPEEIKWNLIAQTACTTATLAKSYFHGWAIKYDIDEDDENTSDYIDINGKIDHNKRVSHHMAQVKGILAGRQNLKDSIVFKTLNKHPEWKKMCVVIDWTASMYKYGSQVIRWQDMHIAENRIAHLVFFNDGDDFIRERYVKKPGKAGGVYSLQPKKLDDAISMMETVMRNGDGGDLPENNCEALLYAQNNLVGHDAVVMIADAKAGIRDLWLLEQIKIPVHIILCGSKKSLIASDYINLAWRTRGSINTMENAINFTENQLKRPPMEIKLGNRIFEFDARYLKYRLKRH